MCVRADRPRRGRKTPWAAWCVPSGCEMKRKAMLQSERTVVSVCSSGSSSAFSPPCVVEVLPVFIYLRVQSTLYVITAVCSAARPEIPLSIGLLPGLLSVRVVVPVCVYSLLLYFYSTLAIFSRGSALLKGLWQSGGDRMSMAKKM